MVNPAIEPEDESYKSPFSNRYGSDLMRHIWSQHSIRHHWRLEWVELLERQHENNANNNVTIPSAALSAALANVNSIDVKQAQAIEQHTRHDLQAELLLYSQQMGEYGKYLHLGATSSDIEDRATTALCNRSLQYLREYPLKNVILRLCTISNRHASNVTVGYTHLQPAIPTTIGYRFATTLIELYKATKRIPSNLQLKPFAGATGTQAALLSMFPGDWLQPDVTPNQYPYEELACGQTSSRMDEYNLIATLAGVAGVLSKFALDLRHMQSAGVVAEPVGYEQVGSSAMPHKRNPILCERVCSLARLLASNVGTAWHTAANQTYERTLDDSAARRVYIAESFLILDEILESMSTVLNGLVVYDHVAWQNMVSMEYSMLGEVIMNQLIIAGASRFEAHQALRKLYGRARNNDEFNQGLMSLEFQALNGGISLDIDDLIGQSQRYTGTASRRALYISEFVKNMVEDGNF